LQLNEDELTKHCKKFIEDYQIQHEKFTSELLAECFKQAILSGDFIMHVQKSYPYDKYGYSYIPFREKQALKHRITELENRIERITKILNGEDDDGE